MISNNISFHFILTIRLLGFCSKHHFLILCSMTDEYENFELPYSASGSSTLLAFSMASSNLNTEALRYLVLKSQGFHWNTTTIPQQKTGSWTQIWVLLCVIHLIFFLKKQTEDSWVFSISSQSKQCGKVRSSKDGPSSPALFTWWIRGRVVG